MTGVTLRTNIDSGAIIFVEESQSINVLALSVIMRKNRDEGEKNV